MNTETKPPIRAIEDPRAVERYEVLKRLGKNFFTDSYLVETGVVSEKDVTLARDFLAQVAQEIMPPVYATWWEHTLIAPKLARRLAEATAAKGVDINPPELEFLLLLHDFGRLVIPAAFLRNDLICNRLLVEIGIPREIINKGFSLNSLMELATKNGNPKTYFESLTPTQRLHFLADNLGKRSPQGKLFNLQIFYDYLEEQEARLGELEKDEKKGKRENPWPSIHLGITGRKASARQGFLGRTVVDQTVEWLKNLGVDFQKIRQYLVDYGPKFVIIVRHGEVANLNNIAYNRDNVMKKEDVIHLSKEGDEQMRRLAKSIKEKHFRCKWVVTSPEKRAEESAQSLTLNVPIETSQELDDLYAPGPYQEKITMDQWRRMEGNAYGQRWKDYQHETPDQIIGRVNRAFWKMVKRLQTGETGILVSHGDPIAWLVNSLTNRQVIPKKLRESMYCPKGNALVAVTDPEDKNKVFAIFFLNEVEKDKIY
jgi:broad specificity phosphatase PhoE